MDPWLFRKKLKLSVTARLCYENLIFSVSEPVVMQNVLCYLRR